MFTSFTTVYNYGAIKGTRFFVKFKEYNFLSKVKKLKTDYSFI